jgi:hypothetical protein
LRLATSWRQVVRVALYSRAGWLEQAQAETAVVLRLNPQFSLAVWRQTLPMQDQATLEYFLALLHQAGHLWGSCWLRVASVAIVSNIMLERRMHYAPANMRS